MVATVGVVSTVGCPHCKRAKAALKDAGVEYAEAQLSGAKEVLAKVKETTGQTTVPQVFIGGKFIGGASDLATLMAAGDFQTMISAAADTPAFPSDIADLIAAHVAREEAAAVDPEGDRAAALAKSLPSKLDRPEVKIAGQPVRAFTAKSLATFLTAAGETDVAAAAELLLNRRVIAPTSPVGAPAPPFDPTSADIFYQLPSDARAAPLKLGTALNIHTPWYGPAREAVVVSGVLRAMILELYDAHLAPDGGAVNYTAMATDPLFERYVDATTELQKVDLSSLLREERIAFFVNIYNALIVHGTVAFGSPSKLLKRLKFFGAINYVIGGSAFSADDIEHGVLRSNAASPANWGSLLGIPFLKKPQFPDGDARLPLVVTPLDPRIHFALVCGAKSCPPIKLYTPENLNEGLQDAASAFCDGEIEVDEASSTVTMSKILKWYGGDFAEGQNERLTKFAAFLPAERKEQLLKLIASDKKLAVKYKPYDWSPNASH